MVWLNSLLCLPFLSWWVVPLVPINSSSDWLSGLSLSCALFWWSWYALTGIRKYAFLHSIWHTPKTHTLAILFLGSELVWFLMCTLQVTLTVACLVQYVSWPCFNVHSSGDTDCGLSCSVCELALFECALLWWHWLWPALFQPVSWPCFWSALFWWWLWPVLFREWVGLVLYVHCSGDTDCGLSCFSQWVGLVLMCTVLVTLTVACLVSGSELAWFLVCTLLVMLTVACLVSESELALFSMCTILVTLTVACLVSVCELAWF